MEKIDEKCIKCKEKLDDNDTLYSCDSCLRHVHKECSTLSTSEERCMPLRKRVLLYICADCRGLIARMPHMIQMLDQIKKDIEELKQHKHVETSNDIPKEPLERTYSEALTSTTLVSTEQTIIIKPKRKCDIYQAQKMIQQTLNPSELSIGIKRMRSTKNGDIIIKCPTQVEGEKLKNAAINQLADTCIVETITKRLPRLKVVGVEKKNLSNDSNEIEQSIRKQNKWIKDNEDLKVTYIKTFEKNKNSNATIYLECSANLYHKAINEKKIYLGWQRCPVYEELSIQKCFTCQEYFHKTPNCNNPIACVAYSESHDVSEWSETVKKCKNCVLANNKYHTNYNTNHAANDIDCPTYQYHISCLRSKIDYGS